MASLGHLPCGRPPDSLTLPLAARGSRGWRNGDAEALRVADAALARLVEETDGLESELTAASIHYRICEVVSDNALDPQHGPVADFIDEAGQALGSPCGERRAGYRRAGTAAKHFRDGRPDAGADREVSRRNGGGADRERRRANVAHT